MNKVISISNHKGGVGKTTTTINLGAGLCNLGKKVLLIDLDPQANLSQSLGIMERGVDIYTYLLGIIEKQDIPTKTTIETVKIIEGLEAIPSTLDLSGAEVELSGENGREYILKELVGALRSSYDYILIDCPPSLGLLTINALTASDMVLIPIQAQYLALQGLTRLLDVIERINERLNKKLKVGGVIITQYDKRKILNRDVSQSIGSHLQDKVFKTKIRDTVALAEAPARGLDIFRYQPKSYGAKDYLSLCKEFLERVE